MSGVAAVIVNFGTSHLVQEIDAIGDVPVIVVDNFTTEAEQRRIGGICLDRGWELISLPLNVGFGAGSNAGVKRVIERGFEHVLLLNPDARISCESVARLVDTLVATGAGAVVPSVILPDGRRWFTGFRLDRIVLRASHHDGLAIARGEPLWMTAACLVVPTRVYEEVGGFDEQYFLYWEDVDFTYSIRELGYSLIVDWSVQSVHAVGGSQVASSRLGSKSTSFAYYSARNRMIFSRKHFSRFMQMIHYLSTPISLAYMAKDFMVRESPGYAARLLHAAIRGALASARPGAG
jgi:N-acetylglucosaminyl-diphospho-decaprenol L-rhamnosyltransferase